MTFGQGGANYISDSPLAVAQAIYTRLTLFQGNWYLDTASGTPWFGEILGERRQPGAPDAAIRARIMGTPYVVRLEDYASAYNSSSRSFVVSARIWTAFGLIDQAPPGALISPRGALVMPLRQSEPDHRFN